MALDFSSELKLAARQIAVYIKKNTTIPEDLLKKYDLLSTLKNNQNVGNNEGVFRLVNSTSDSNLLSTVDTTINNIYMDNLAASAQFILIYQNTVGTPVGSIGLVESYRVFSNITFNLNINRKFIGPVYIAFSSAAGTFTPATQLKNVAVTFTY
jgi:hypothetical protein